MKVYKVQNRVNGLYSEKGTLHSWSKHGYVWNKIGSVKGHITQCTENGKYKGQNISNIVLIEYDLVPTKTMELSQDYKEIVTIML